MIAWELVDEASLPDQTARMQLVRRGAEYVIRVDGKDLMSSRVHGSEQALAELACARLHATSPRLLVGGLGMGFTLRAALEACGADASIVVAELFEAVVRWNHGPLAPLAGAPLDDPRVTVHTGDVRELLEEPTDFDAILLDVDNGPDGLTRSTNSWLYEPAGLRAFHRTLRPRGVLAVWSAFDDPRFTKRLQKAGFDVEVERVRARGTKGSRHTIWLATLRS